MINKPKAKQEVVTLERFLKIQWSMTFWKCCTYTQQKKKHNKQIFGNMLFLRFFFGTVNNINMLGDFRTWSQHFRALLNLISSMSYQYQTQHSLNKHYTLNQGLHGLIVTAVEFEFTGSWGCGFKPRSWISITPPRQKRYHKRSQYSLYISVLVLTTTL